jgi:hypothetical protein
VATQDRECKGYAKEKAASKKDRRKEKAEEGITRKEDKKLLCNTPVK